MSSSDRRYYRKTYIFDLEPLSPKDNYVKVSYFPGVAAGVTPSGDYSSSAVNTREYKTLSYSTPQKAFTHAKGWVDCMEHFYSCKHTPDDDENSYAKEYDEKLKYHKENPDEQDKGSLFSEDAYKEGWDKKVSELKVDGNIGN